MANIYGYYGIDSSDIFYNLLPVGEWKYYDSNQDLEKIIIFDSLLKKVEGMHCPNPYNTSSNICPGGYHFEHLPKNIMYVYNGIKYREEEYKNGLLVKTSQWKKAN